MQRQRAGVSVLRVAAAFTILASAGPDLLTPPHAFNAAWPLHPRFGAPPVVAAPVSNSLVALPTVAVALCLAGLGAWRARDPEPETAEGGIP